MQASTKLISINRTARTFIFSILAITAPYYLSGFEVPAVYIALIIMMSGVVSTFFVYGFSRLIIGDRLKLILLSALLTLSLLLLITLRTLPFYILSIIIGGIPLSGKDFTNNQAIEQYSISIVEQERRSKNVAFAIYNFGSYASAAVASGVIFLLYHGNIEFFYEICFVLSFVQFITYSTSTITFRHKDRIAPIKSEAKNPDVPMLSFLFSLDSLGGGLVITSMISLWFKIVYGVSLAQVGLIFVIVNIVTALSIIISSAISNRMGLVRTMVYTHIVSNVFLILIPILHSLVISEALLYLRQTTSQMDVPARDSFVNTLIPHDQRVKANSRFVMVRNFFQIPGPAIGGAFFELYPPLLFISAGGVKIFYDFLFYWRYRKTNL
ncbi:MAG: MFS transporter [Thermoplasmataceae archaeon]